MTAPRQERGGGKEGKGGRERGAGQGRAAPPLWIANHPPRYHPGPQIPPACMIPLPLQVYISYGPVPNLKLLCYYGFVIPNNPHDLVPLELEVR